MTCDFFNRLSETVNVFQYMKQGDHIVTFKFRYLT